MTGRRSHGRLSALNGVVHQGSTALPIMRPSFLVLPGLAWVEVEPSAVKIDRRREV